MFWTILALLLLIILGGFISYYGDLQGRRWGKKRVSWFGLRPKHTAIVITSITGSVIALLSVGALMLVVPNVRDIVLRGETAIAVNKKLIPTLEKEVETAAGELKRKSFELSDIQKRLNDNQEQLKNVNTVLASLHQKNAASTQKNAELTSRVSALDKQQKSLETQQKELRSQLVPLEDKVKLKQQELASLTNKLNTANKENKTASRMNNDLGRQTSDLIRQKSELEIKIADLQKSNIDLQATNQKVSEDNTDLQKKRDELTSLNSTLRQAYVALREANDKAQNEISALEGKRSVLQTQLTGSYTDSDRTYISFRQARFILHPGAELARYTIDAHLSPKAIKEELMRVMNEASIRAEMLGATKGTNGRAIRIVDKHVVTPLIEELADEEASFNAIADNLAGSNTPVVVIARALNNSLPNEPALVELSSYASGTVFAKGEIVASRRIDATQSTERIVQSLQDFLKTDVRAAAIKAGIVPQMHLDTADEEVGNIGTPEFFTLLERVKRMGGLVQLRAVANTNITTGNLLTFEASKESSNRNLRFELSRASKSLSSPSQP